MGKKKDAKEKKIKGAEKTRMKTEKKVEKKAKKQLKVKGEKDIEALIAECQEHAAKRQETIEEKCPPPSPRCNMSLTAHPDKDILILFGGEYFNGNKTFVYNDIFFYHIKTSEWTQMRVPNTPAPRCSHQAVALPQRGGELWIFGGEFPSPSQSQFHHYRDLWLLQLRDLTWRKINANGGPSPRSGHRMVAVKKMLFVFGGYHDNLREYKYFNDLHVFDTENYQWMKVNIGGVPPSPRSGCVMAAVQDQVVVYGGYSKERIKKDCDKGQIHSDMFVLDCKIKPDSSENKWKWSQVKQSGCKPSARCSSSLVATAGNRALLFGGVFDEKEDEETLEGLFYNDMYSLELDKGRWYPLTLRTKPDDAAPRRRRRKAKPADGSAGAPTSDGSESESDGEEEVAESGIDDQVQRLNVTEAPPAKSVTTFDDGVFTVTVGGAGPSSSSASGGGTVGSAIASRSINASGKDSCSPMVPCPRMNAALAVKNGQLFLYGGALEDGDRQVTLADFYSLDLHRLDAWRTIVAPLDVSKMEWEESDESSDDNEDATAGASGQSADMDTDDDDDDESDDDDDESEEDSE